jgi:hypothetical protein
MRFPLFAFFAVSIPVGLAAVQTGVIVDEGYADFFQGELKNVSLSRNGELGTAPNLTEVAQLTEPFIWKVIEDGAGNFILGTGNSGKVIQLSADGSVEALFTPDSIISRGLARDEAGNLFVATSPNGAIFRLPAEGGKPELFFDPEAVYVWDLEIAEGALWLTTGLPAQFLRLPLDDAEAEAEVWFEARDDHLKGLLRHDGEWLIGSSSRGILYGVTSPDNARAIFKADEKEIRALAVAGDGSILISTYSDKARRPTPTKEGDLPPLTVSATTEAKPDGSNSLRKTGGEGYVIRLDEHGIASGEWRSREGGIFAMAPVGKRHWLLGFSEDGKLYGFEHRDSWELMQQMPRGGQISAIVQDSSDPGSYYIFTSNPGVVYRLGGQSEEDCQFLSQILDARQAVSWGRLETTFSSEGAYTVETRTGLTDKPDTTWGDWTPLDNGRIASASGRFFQYRLTFPPDSSARFLRARAFHTMPNAPPIISQVRVLAFGAEMRTAQMNGQMLDFSAAFSDDQMEKFQRGSSDRIKLERTSGQTLRTLLWRAGDPNGDRLTYAVYQRRADETEWTVMARGLDDPTFLFNAAGLEPGYYQFKVVASDAPSNAHDLKHETERTSELVLLDATPPELALLEAGAGTVRFQARSDVSRLVAAQLIVDGGEPISLRPVDGLFDDPEETFVYSLEGGTGDAVSALFEVLDESGNQAALPLRVPAAN